MSFRLVVALNKTASLIEYRTFLYQNSPTLSPFKDVGRLRAFKIKVLTFIFEGSTSGEVASDSYFSKVTKAHTIYNCNLGHT
jgi:hypothetical protein